MLKKIYILICVILFCGRVFAATPEEQARDYYSRGNLYYQQGMFQQAQEEYNKAMEVMKGVESRPAEKQPQAFPEVPKPEVPAAVERAQTQAAVSAGSSEYVIGDDDILKISVWQNQDLDQEAIVRPDGKISVPLIGDVSARGRTITQLDNELTRLLSEYIRSPEVSISLRKIGGSKVIMLGEIAKPGVYSMTGQRTLLEAVGLAGGFTRDAVSSSIVLIRGGLSDPKPVRINLSKALKGREFTKQNIVLQAEDVIFVPKKFIADLNYFLSQIVDPLSKGAYIKDQYNADW